MGFLKREEKPQEKVKAAKANLPSHAADTSTTCFKCGKPGHLQKECKEGKNDSSQSGGYCSGCGAKGHSQGCHIGRLSGKSRPKDIVRTHPDVPASGRTSESANRRQTA
jgi:hypothetical protein